MLAFYEISLTALFELLCMVTLYDDTFSTKVLMLSMY